MKLTPRDKKLLYTWPILWPTLAILLILHWNNKPWLGGFLRAIGAVILCSAGAYLLYAAFKILYRLKSPRSPAFRLHRNDAFTLIELLVVIAIVGILAALAAPALSHFRKGDSIVTTTRQMLDDCARARQLAISQRCTVFMVFVSTNFWQDPFNVSSPNMWTPIQNFCPQLATSTMVTNLYNAQMTGYVMYSLRQVGDQPGAGQPRDLLKVHTLPSDFFIPSWKWTTPTYYSGGAPMVVQSNFAVYGFLTTNIIPFPSADTLTNSAYVQQRQFQHLSFPTVSYIAFNYLGQLTPGDGSVLPYDEYIPLAHGLTLYTHGTPFARPTLSAQEVPPGNSTNISYNLIHIDRITGRARLETSPL